MPVILQYPQGEQTLGDFLQKTFLGEYGSYHTVDAAIAFVKSSGVSHIRGALQHFLAEGGSARFAVGVDQQGTSYEGLSELWNILQGTGEIWINHDENWFVTFHPKLYLFTGEHSALLIVGSGNLTEGGLFTNDEATLIQQLDLEKNEDAAIIDQVKHAVDSWCNSELGISKRLDDDLLENLVAARLIRPEAESSVTTDSERTITTSEAPSETDIPRLFQRGPSRRRPRRTRAATLPLFRTPAASALPRGFVMTLQQTDVGTGQLTPGASRRSPEIFVPLSARDEFPLFWGWPDLFTEDPNRPGKLDRHNVPMRKGGEIITVNMMTWPIKHDFRLRAEAIRSAGEIGDILRIERAPSQRDYDYYVEIIPIDTADYGMYLELCQNPVRNSRKRWGYYD